MNVAAIIAAFHASQARMVRAEVRPTWRHATAARRPQSVKRTKADIREVRYGE